MTQRRDLEARLALYGDLAGILGAMRSFALAELRRLAQREPAQQQTAAAVEQAFSAVLPAPEAAAADIWLLLGSVRGFCASFNEDVLRLWEEKAKDAAATIVVGERLQSMMPETAASIAVPGTIGATDAVDTIDRILLALPQLAGGNLIVCYRGENGAVTQRLLPMGDQREEDAELPMTNEPAPQVAAEISQHLLFHRLLSLLLHSLRVENHMRLMQMENALQHIGRASDTLRRQRSQLRQSEIIEEIESILRDKSHSASRRDPLQTTRA